MDSIFKRLATISALLAIVVGCAESQRPQARGEGTIRALNAAVTAPPVGFLLEERVLDNVDYKEATSTLTFDGLEYTANFDFLFFGEISATRLASIPFELVQDNDYLFVFTGSLAEPDAMVWERPIRQWDTTDTTFEVAFGHLSPALGAVDVYFAETGTVPMAGAAVATLNNNERSAIIELEAAEYEIILTTAGDPADILYQSIPVTYVAANNYLIPTFDPDPTITSPISVRLITYATGSSVEIANASTPPNLRVLHAVSQSTPIDVYRDGDFSAPFIANVDYTEISAATSTPAPLATWTFTEAGNQGVVILETDFAVLNSGNTTQILGGSAGGGESVLPVIDNLRSVSTGARLRFLQMATDQNFVDIYLLAAGDDIEEATPRFFGQGFQGNSGYITVIQNDYEIYATVPTETTVLAGPFPFTAVPGDVIHFALMNTDDPMVLQWVKYDHINNLPPP